jgi:hypothetical protein
MLALTYVVIFLIQTAGPVVVLHYYLNHKSPKFQCGAAGAANTTHVKFFGHEKWFLARAQDDPKTCANDAFKKNGDAEYVPFYETINEGPIRVLGAAFMMLLSLQAVGTARAEREAATDALKIFDWYGFPDKEGSHWSALALGAFVNAWLIFSVNWITFIVLGTSDAPIDVFLNAMAIGFILTLDDENSGLNLIDEKHWNGKRLAWLRDVAPLGDPEVGWDPNDEDSKCELPETTLSGCIWGLYTFVEYSAMLASLVLPILFVAMPWDSLYGDDCVVPPESRVGAKYGIDKIVCTGPV